MNIGIEPIALLIMFANVVVSYQGFSKRSFYERYLFEVDPILVAKDYIRVISSGFLHVSWWHLLFNMYALYVFSQGLEGAISVFEYLLIYFGSLLGGNALSLYIHRFHGDYRAVGASGAVSGIIFSSIALVPGISIGFIFIPISIPGWLFGIGYVLVSIYGIRSQRGNIGHDAHLGGALVGLVMAVLFYPAALQQQPWVILGIFLPVAIFMYLIITRPEILLTPFSFKNEWKQVKENMKSSTPRPKKKMGKKRFISKEAEINYLLDKGLDNLTKEERDRLEELSKD